MSYIIGTVVETDQGIFCLDPNDNFVSKSLIEDGSYGLYEIERLKNIITPETRILVVGTHIGSLCIPLSKMCKYLVGIEANPNTFKYLEMNVKLNDCENVSVHNVAANDTNGLIQFVLNTDNSGGSKRKPLYADKDYYYDDPETVTVEAVRLDEFLENQYFDIILMDIEGSEYFALCGMQNILETAHTLIVEYLPHHLSRVAGITPEQFLEPISKHYDTLSIPVANYQTFLNHQFLQVLSEMSDRNIGDDGIIFRKTIR